MDGLKVPKMTAQDAPGVARMGLGGWTLGPIGGQIMTHAPPWAEGFTLRPG